MLLIETPVFSAMVGRYLSDEEYRSLQVALVIRPDQGRLIPGSGGLRKLRWRIAGIGKRGGLRVIYYWIGQDDTVLLLYLYSKAEQDDLTFSQMRALTRLAREELG